MAIERGIEILRECETRLRGLLAEAAAAGDYESVLRLTGWAKAVGAMASGACAPSSDSQGAECLASQRHLGNPDSGLRKTSSPGPLPASRTAGVQRGRKVRRKGKSARSGYPRFSRLKDELLKIGWSKGDKKEYQHKAPRRVVDCLVDRLLSLGGNGNLFTTEELLPLHDPTDGADVPTYQLYVCLAWLRHENLVHQEGRQGYSIPDSAQFRDSVNESWQRLMCSAR